MQSCRTIPTVHTNTERNQITHGLSIWHITRDNVVILYIKLLLTSTENITINLICISIITGWLCDRYYYGHLHINKYLYTGWHCSDFLITLITKYGTAAQAVQIMTLQAYNTKYKSLNVQEFGASWHQNLCFLQTTLTFNPL